MSAFRALLSPRHASGMCDDCDDERDVREWEHEQEQQEQATQDEAHE